MPITVKSTGGGSVTLTAPVTASDLTLTLPSSSGTVALASSQSFADATFTGTTTFPGSGTWDSSGNVGIGTSSPGYRLDVQANSASQAWASFKNTNAAGTGGFFLGNDSFSDIGAIGAQGSSGSAFGGANSIYVGTWRAYPLAFITNNTERARIDSSGNLLVGKTTTAETTVGACFSVSANNIGLSSGNYFIVNYVPGGSSTMIDFRTGGVSKGSISQNGSNVAYNTSSDYRLKSSVASITAGLSTICSLKPVTYKWNDSDNDGEGFIAHELQEVIPHAVTGEKDAVNEDGSIKPQGVDYSKIVVHLVAAIQEQQAQITELKAEIATLKGAA